MKFSKSFAWTGVCETALLSFVFLAPLAVSAYTWDPNAMRTTLFEMVALTLACSWLMKGLDRGRWDVASGLWSVLAPAAGWVGWTLIRFLLSHFKLLALPDLVLFFSCGVFFLIGILEFGGRFFSATPMMRWLGRASHCPPPWPFCWTPNPQKPAACFQCPRWPPSRSRPQKTDLLARVSHSVRPHLFTLRWPSHCFVAKSQEWSPSEDRFADYLSLLSSLGELEDLLPSSRALLRTPSFTLEGKPRRILLPRGPSSPQRRLDCAPLGI